MEVYLEQSVAGKDSPGRMALYALCWLGIALLVLAALFCAAGVFESAPEGVEIHWLRLAGMIVCLALAAVLFRQKDRLRTEYDYFLRDDALEVFGVYNRRRRRALARIPLEKLSRIGPASGAALETLRREGKLRWHDWHVRSEGLYYICYAQDDARHAALLELNDEMAAALRHSRRLPTGAWRDANGKAENYAGLS